MVIGHYFPSFAAKRVEKNIPLWLLFISAQFIDVVWAVFIITGIEGARIIPGSSGENILDNYYIPFTHSLPGAIVLSGIVFIIFKVIRKSNREALVLALVVFSHWVFDLVSHHPDLPLWGNSYKVGFGLSNFPVVDLIVQVSLFLIGMALYVRYTEPVSNIGKYGVIVFCALVVMIQVAATLPPAAQSPQRLGITMLLIYFSTTAIVFWIERNRNERPLITTQKIMRGE